MANIIVVPPKTLSPKQKEHLTKKGVIVIETDNPEKVRVLQAEPSFENSDWFMAALHAMTRKTSYNEREHFVNNLYQRLSKTENL